MHNALRMGRKAFTVSIVVATIAWSIGLAALLLPLAASASVSGDLIKASLPAVYYHGADGKRYVFPNEKTYKTWFNDFSGVKTISDSELAALSIGGNVTYKPGVRMVKITSDPKVYAVSAGGSLRHVGSEALATSLYGSSWNTMIDDVSDAFFTNYSVGSALSSAGDYNKDNEKNAATSINVDKGLSSVAGGGGLTLALNSGNQGSVSVVVDTDGESSGQQRTPMLKMDLTAGSGGVNVSSLKFKRSGISKDSDFDSLYLMENGMFLAQSISLTSGVATFNSLGLSVNAGQTRTLELVANLNTEASSGSTVNWSLASADVTSDASSVSGSAVGNTMTFAVVTDLGQLEVNTPTAPASVDPGTDAKELWRVTLSPQAQDLLVTYLKLTDLGSATDGDITNLKLLVGGIQLDGTVGKSTNKEVSFDLTSMTGGGYKIKTGEAPQLVLQGDVVSGTNRTFQWSIQQQYDMYVKDLQYNVWVPIANNSSDSLTVRKPAAATDINTGKLSVNVSTDSPSTNVPDGGTSIELAKFDFVATGEDVKITALTVICQSSTAANTILNTKILLDGAQVGTTDATMTCGSETGVANYTFGNSLVITMGSTHKVKIVSDLTGTLAANDTLYVGFGGTATAQGKLSLTSITPSNVNGRTLTAKTGTVSVIKDQTYADRSSSFPTGVSNAQAVKIGALVIIGGAGEAVDVTQIVLRDNTSDHFLGDNFQNLKLKDRDGNQVGTSVASLNTTEGTYTFSPASSIRLAAGAQKAFDVFADVKGTVTDGATNLNAVEVDTIAATGVTTGASANFGTAGNDATDVALQINYISIEGNLTVDEAPDTAVAQQLVLGATGQSLAKFKLSADASESLVVTQLIVADDMSTGQGAATASVAVRAATGTLKNLKLYNGSTLLASVASLDSSNNTVTPLATFTGFSLTVPKNQNLTLEVKADLATYDDGGAVSSTHRLFIPKNPYVAVSTGANDSNLATNSITVVGAGSGNTISGGSLDFIGGTSTAALTDVNVVGSYLDMVRAKLTLAHASDSPSGAASSNSEQTVAKFVASNSSNAGSYSVNIRNMNLTVSHTGASMTGAANLKIYKDSISSSNQLASTSYCTGSACTASGNYRDSGVAEGDFTDLEVSAGSSRTVVVTLNTSVGSMAANDTLSVGLLSTANTDGFAPVQWDDGVNHGGSDLDYYNVDSLPLAGKTLVY